ELPAPRRLCRERELIESRLILLPGEQQQMMKRDRFQRRADLAAGMYPTLPSRAPIRELGPEAKRRLRRPHELALVDGENAMDRAQRRQTALLRKKIGFSGVAGRIDHANRHG